MHIRLWGVSPQFVLGCRWYALLLTCSVNIRLALCGAWSGALDVTGWRSGDLQLKSADGVASWKAAGSVAFHWSSLGGACCSVKPDEARELIRLVPTQVFADLLLSMVTLRLTERATWTRELNVLTCLSHLANWTDPRRLVNCFEADPSVDTVRNNTWIVATVGYHGNPLYRAVAWMPICISVTSVAKLPTCGRLPQGYWWERDH
jgi:hypothetical protein